MVAGQVSVVEKIDAGGGEVPQLRIDDSYFNRPLSYGDNKLNRQR